MIARTKFGRSAMLELMILAPDFQALDISTGGMRPSCEISARADPIQRIAVFKRCLPAGGQSRLN
jgi:hypothetical protein